MESCLYEGVVYHERLQPLSHRFHYRLYMSYLDLAEVPELMRAGLLSDRLFSWNGFLRRDHFGHPQETLINSVRELVLQKTGFLPDGPIRLLTQLRFLGYYFSPLNLFFCYARDGSRLQAIVAEVQNTPWLQRHCYVLWQGNQLGTGRETEYCIPKTFHVSPFFGMDLDHHWRVSAPGNELHIGIENTVEQNPLFRAWMTLHRVPLSHRTQRAMQWRYPHMTARITAAIYLQAFHLWRKKCPFYPHPKHRLEPTPTRSTRVPSVPEPLPVSAAAD